MNGPPNPTDTPPPRATARRGWARISPTAWLTVVILAYFAVSFSLSWLRAVEFQTTTWDMGVYQQALWSTAHGRPFYEAADLESGGYHSLLQVHTAFLLYALVPLYAALPYQTTLFAVQSLVVAAAAAPLFLLGRDLTRSGRWGLVAAVAYLVWAPTLSSNLYDFHPESFLPLEIFSVVLLWERGRYWAGAAVVAIAWATLEIAPVLLAFVGIFFLWPSGATWARWWGQIRDRAPGSAWVSEGWAALSSRRVQASLVLVLASTLAYFLLVYVRADYLNAALGMTVLPVPSSGYVIGGTLGALGLSWQNLSVGFGTKLTYWVVALALLGLVPLLAPRALIIGLPWFAFTMFEGTPNYAVLGFQYGFIAAASLFVAFTYGLPRARDLLRSWLIRWENARPDTPRGWTTRPAWTPRGRRRGIGVAVVVVFVGVNLSLSPVNPLLQNQGIGSGYRISYDPSPGYAEGARLAGLIPSGATVLASDDLFPLVANDVNAYSFSWMQDNFLDLPFTASHLPQFILISEKRGAAVPSWLQGELYNESIFRVRGVVWSTDIGPLLLFQLGYAGPTAVFGSPPPSSILDTGASLADPAAGFVPTGAIQGSIEVAASVPGVVGSFFDGPWANLSAGNYTVTLRVFASSFAGAPPPAGSEATLWVGANEYAQAPYFGETLEFAQFNTTGWTVLGFEVHVPGPTVQFTVQGEVLATNAQVVLENLAVAPS